MSESPQKSGGQTDQNASAGPTAAPPESPCPECGEMVRRGLVRCWNCGAFMEKKIEKHYQQMQENPAPLVFSQLPEGEAVSVEDDAPDFEMGDAAGAGAAPVTDLSSLESAAVQEAETEAPPDETAGEGETPQSAASGGDALLEVALEEQREARKRRRRRPAMTGGARTPGGFIIFCPYGCRMEVKESHRGMTGRCPKCGAPFVVPVDPPEYKTAKKERPSDGRQAEAGAIAAWLEDLHLHAVPPEKLKLVPGSHKGEFVEADVIVRPDSLLIVKYAKKGGGLFGGAVNKEDVRRKVRAHLEEGKPDAELPDVQTQKYAAESLEELRVVQPAASRAQSIFQGVAVFGEGRIAVLLPMRSEDAPPEYLSMGVTQFRKFAKALSETLGIEGLGAGCGIPMEDEYVDVGRCHYLQVLVRGLKHLKFYEEDPTADLELAGWKCASCGMVISEDARQKEKLGGKGGKGLAKVKCPKCQQKFGEDSYYTRAGSGHASMSGEETEREPAGAAE